MKLRIIDNTDTNRFHVELSYLNLPAAETSNEASAPRKIIKESFTVDDFSSPFSNAFLTALNEYFCHFPYASEHDIANQTNAQTRAQEVMTKFIKAGQYLGDALLGENHTLNKFRELIEERGYHQCEVQIESSRIALFELPWEALILPESNYLLSTTAASFKRIFVAPNKSCPTPEAINLTLKVVGPTQQQLQQVLAENTGNTAATNVLDDSHTPLQILTVCDANCDDSSQRTTHLAHESVFSELSFDTAINIELAAIEGITSLHYAIQQQGSQVLCLTGQIAFNDGEASWCCHNNRGETSHIPLTQLFELMQQQTVPLLIFNIDTYQQNGADILASTGLAFVSCQAEQAGIHNVIGFNAAVNGFVRQQILTAFYQQLTKGLSVAQAVVETRKQLQSDSSSQALSLTDRAIQIWPLLTHYGNQSLVFFATAPPLIDAQIGIENAQQTQAIFQHMFGFIDTFMPVNSTVGKVTRFDNGEFVKLASTLQKRDGSRVHGGSQERSGSDHSATTAIVTGRQGSGKTLLAHAVAFFAVQKQCCEHAFRFDFSIHSYSQQDMLTMIAPVLGVEAEVETSAEVDQTAPSQQNDFQQAKLATAVLAKLQHTRCLLVFDNVNLANDHSHGSETQSATKNHHILNLIATFNAAGQSILITTVQEPAHWQMVEHATHVDIKPLTATQTLAILSRYQTRHSDKTPDQKPSVTHLFTLEQQALVIAQHSQFNPWLIDKLGTFLPQLGENDRDNVLPTAWQKHIDADSPKTSFHHWQWQQLSQGLQHLLLICSEFGDILLEILMVAWEREKAISSEITALLPNPLFNDTIPDFSTAIAKWKQQGFVTAHPHGHIIASDAQQFFQPILDDSPLRTYPDLPLLNSRLLCAGLRILGDHVLRQQNPAIFRHLLTQRALWAQQLQTLWAGEYFGEFIKTKSVIEQLMQQAQLGDEFAAWASRLLQQIDVQPLAAPENLTTKQAENHIAWLSVATSTLKTEVKIAGSSTTDNNQLPVSQLLEQAAEQSRQWLDRIHHLPQLADKPHPAHLLATVQHCNTFLTQYYSQRQAWQQVINCNQHSLGQLERAQAWPLVSNILMTLANANVQLNNNHVAREYEDRIIFALTYDGAPAGYRAQKIVDVIINRIQRQDIATLDPLVVELEKSDDAKRWQAFLIGVKADIAYTEKRWEDALPYYGEMWQQVNLQLQTQSGQTQQAPNAQAKQQLDQQQKQLLERLLHIERHMPVAAFKTAFQALLGKDIPLPSDTMQAAKINEKEQ